MIKIVKFPSQLTLPAIAWYPCQLRGETIERNKSRISWAYFLTFLYLSFFASLISFNPSLQKEKKCAWLFLFIFRFTLREIFSWINLLHRNSPRSFLGVLYEESVGGKEIRTKKKKQESLINVKKRILNCEEFRKLSRHLRIKIFWS